MSVQAITWALDFRVRSATEKAILLVLANYANEYGISWPSQPTVAEQAACNERTVRRTLLEFETRGVLNRFPRWRRNGSRQSDVILLVAFQGREPAPPGFIEGVDDEQTWQAENLSTGAANRTPVPGAKRSSHPELPGEDSALDPSLILGGKLIKLLGMWRLH
jgi:hypothetical protein